VQINRRSGPTMEIMRPEVVQKIEAFYLKKKKKNITVHAISATKLLIKLLYLIFSNKSCSIDNMANPFNFFYVKVDLK
jgi:hypothetical protein